MSEILYGVSPIGLGHATRAAAVGSKLLTRGIGVEFAAGGKASSFLSSLGFRVHEIVKEPIPFESEGRIKFPALWYARYWLGYRSSRSKMSELIDKLKPDLVVGDEEFSSVSTAVERGLANALISDELELDFARSFLARVIERRVSDWYTDLQKRVSHLVIPEFGEDSGNVHYVGPVVREITKDRATILKEYGLPSGKIILFSASGSGLGEFFLRRTVQAFERLGLRDNHLVVVGSGNQRRIEGVINLGTVPDNQNLIAAADLVISTAGKSTIDEALSSGTPIIALPFKDHFEQEKNAGVLGFSYADVDRLESLIPERLGMRSEPKNYRGAEKAASLLAGLAWAHSRVQ